MNFRITREVFEDHLISPRNRLNTKIALCALRLEDKAAGTSEVLETRSRAAFENLTYDRGHGVPVSA